MKRISSYLKMRVLGAIESAPGPTNVARIRHVSEQAFVDEDGRRFQFTWRTIAGYDNDCLARWVLLENDP